MGEWLLVFMRWLHIGSAVALVGGMLFGRVAFAPSTKALAAEAREDVLRRGLALYRPVLLSAVAGALFTGIYNILSSPGHSARYHALLGVKVLLAAHIFAVALLLAAGKTSRPGRAMLGAAISGFVVIAIAAYLQRIY